MTSLKPFLPLLMSGLFLLSACRPPLSLFVAPQQPASPVIATTHAAGDHATVAGDTDVTVTIASERGIGALDLTWPPAAPPASLTLHLQLHGLEELRLASTPTQLRVAVLSRPPYATLETVAHAGTAETPITPADPYWATVTIEPATGATAIPLEDGYFAVQIPPQLLTDAAGQLAVHWVDFYR